MRALSGSGSLGDQLDLVGFGEAMVLLQPDPGDTLAASDQWGVHVAGAELNACAAAAALGARATFRTRVGDDPLADHIRARADGAGISLDADIDPHAPTGLFLKDDPVGAGDAFTGGYLAGRLGGLDPAGASWLGSALAAAVIAQPGDIAGLPGSADAPRLLSVAGEHQAAQR